MTFIVATLPGAFAILMAAIAGPVNGRVKSGVGYGIEGQVA